MNTGKVLLVDDNEDFLEILSERITSKGLAVETAESGTAALANPELGKYDAVILDLVMPEMDGIETLKKMLAANPELQIILMTGHASLEKGIEAVKLGAMDFLEKPAEIQSLMKKIQEAQAKKMLLVEKKNESKIREIVFTKGW
ncbi:MAG: response regulator [Desulfatibacillum sp.]|nr:response regulator [Desulfatibacillum sp.]